MYGPSNTHHESAMPHHLLIILLVGIVDDVEETELVNTFGGGDNAEPVSQLLLLEELLCPIPNILAQSSCLT